MIEPALKVIGDSLFVVYKDRAVFEFARLVEHRDSLSSEITVVNGGGVEVHWARVNLVSTQARSSLVKALEEAEPVGDWRPLVDQATRLVVKHVRVGEPAVPLEAEERDPTHWAVDRLIPRNQLSCLFADGGTGKSYVALALALTGLLDRQLVPSWRMMPLSRVLYLDWEADRREQASRLHELILGLGSAPVSGALMHRTMRRPLVDDVAAIRAEVARHRIDFVVTDSLAPACGEKPETAESVIPALQALRSLATTVLILAHVSKVAADQKGPAKPFGSVFVYNLCRSVIEARRSDPAGDSEGYTVTLYHRKSNHGPLMRPTAMKMTFANKALTVSRGTPDTGGTSIGFQIIEELRSGKKSTVTLCATLEISAAVCRTNLSRLKARNIVEREVRQNDAGKPETLWYLIDTRRNIERNTEETVTQPAELDDDDRVPF